MKETVSKKNLLEDSTEDLEYHVDGGETVNDVVERPLGPVEKKFLLHAERGDCATVKKYAENDKESCFVKVA